MAALAALRAGRWPIALAAVAAACGPRAAPPPAGAVDQAAARPSASDAAPAGDAAPADPAGSVPGVDLDQLARGVADQVNRLRADPRGYAAELRAQVPLYDGKLWRLPGRDPIRTREGRAPLDAAIRALTRTGKRPPLTWTLGLARAAAQHAADIGARGTLDHTGADGSSPLDRISRHGILQGQGGENIDVGFTDPRLVVIHLLIDDGVPDRGHRQAMLDPAYRQIGVACAPHVRYRVVCVIDLAAGFASVDR